MKSCYVIAAAAEEMSLQSLGPLVNASKPAGATSIFLFLIGPLFFVFSLSFPKSPVRG